MVTKIGRNHYGLHAETIDSTTNTRYSTMRTYSGAITTSEYRILSETAGARVSESTGRRKTHEKVARLTPLMLKKIHEQHVAELKA